MEFSLQIIVIFVLVAFANVEDVGSADTGHASTVTTSAPAKANVSVSAKVTGAGLSCSDYLWQTFLESLASAKPMTAMMAPMAGKGPAAPAAATTKAPAITTRAADSHGEKLEDTSKEVVVGMKFPADSNGTMTSFNFKTSNCSEKNDKWTLEAKLFSNLTSQYNMTAAALHDKLDMLVNTFNKTFMSTFNVSSKGLEDASKVAQNWFKMAGGGAMMTNSTMKQEVKVGNGTVTTKEKVVVKSEAPHGEVSAGASHGSEHGGR